MLKGESCISGCDDPKCEYPQSLPAKRYGNSYHILLNSSFFIVKLMCKGAEGREECWRVLKGSEVR